MTGPKSQNSRVRTTVGTFCLVLGSGVIGVYAVLLGWQFAGLINSSVGGWAGLGMVSLQALRALVFNHSVFFSIVLRMLVSFLALIMTLIGIALLSKRGTGGTSGGRRVESAVPKGGQR